MESKQQVALLLGSLGILSTSIATIIDYFQSSIVEISWLASLFIVLEMIYLRFVVVEPDNFNEYIKSTNSYQFDVKPQRYLNWMTIAMVVGFVATIVIHFDFILGMITYLLMQICLIVSFSGLFSLNPAQYRDDEPSSNLPIISIIVWTAVVVAVYLIFVYSGSESLIVIPYVIFLGLMAHFTWYGLIFSNRDIWFRLFPIIASTFFVFSDSLIGNARYGTTTGPSELYLFINFTYVLNLFFMVNALLFAKEAKS